MFGITGLCPIRFLSRDIYHFKENGMHHSVNGFILLRTKEKARLN